MKIIPTPNKAELTGGSIDLGKIAAVAVENGSDRRITKIAVTLKREIEELCSAPVKLRACSAECTGKGCARVRISHGEAGEGYTLDIDDGGVRIVGDGAAGAYYGVQTLRQIIHEYGDSLPHCRIEDKPEFAERGFYHDVTRGRVPTLKQLCHIADLLAYYKINSLQLYV